MKFNVALTLVFFHYNLVSKLRKNIDVMISFEYTYIKKYTYILEREIVCIYMCVCVCECREGEIKRDYISIYIYIYIYIYI